MVEPASSSLKRLPLSTAWLLRRSRQPVLNVNNHTCSTTSTPGERGRDSSPPEQEGLILSKTEIDLPPTTSLLPRSTADPPPLPPPPRRQKSEHCSSSGQRVKTTKSTQWKKARGSCKMPEGSEENPRGAEDLASTSRMATTNPQKTH